MSPQNYLEVRNELVSSFHNFNIEENETLNSQFNLVSASLSNFLPGIPFSSHAGIYQNILLHKKLSILEQESFEIFDFVETEGLHDNILSTLKNKPSIVCTFHTGSYRVINLFLAKHKIPFTLVIGKLISEQEGSTFSKLYDQLNAANENGFRIINAESPVAGIQMLRELKQKRTLVLYIDGNSGAGSKTNENENSCTVQFLQSQIFARKGIAFLAHTAGVPLITVASDRPALEKIRLRFFEAILPDQTMDRDEFAKRSTQQIFDYVMPLITSYPEQWEGWLYLHKVANVKAPRATIEYSNNINMANEKLVFNCNQFGIFKVQNISFLLRKADYSLYEISTELFDRLKECKHRPAGREYFEHSFHELYGQGVLVSA